MEAANKISFGYDSLDEAFPQIDLNYLPAGSRVTVQVRKPKSKTKGGIILTDEAKDTELWNTQIAKVVAIGPLAFHNRKDMTPWPEGAWCKLGDFVRCPKYGGDRWTLAADDGAEILIIDYNDLDIGGTVPDPLKVKAFI